MESELDNSELNGMVMNDSGETITGAPRNAPALKSGRKVVPQNTELIPQEAMLPMSGVVNPKDELPKSKIKVLHGDAASKKMSKMKFQGNEEASVRVWSMELE